MQICKKDQHVETHDLLLGARYCSFEAKTNVYEKDTQRISLYSR